jgi:hypothetical protein
MQRSFESQPTQLTVNQAAGIAVNAAAAAAVQPAKASHARYLVASLPAARHPQTVSTNCNWMKAARGWSNAKATTRAFNLCAVLAITSECRRHIVLFALPAR